MIFVSDVHGAFTALKRLVGMGEQTIILGDLVNLTDYRTGEGAVADVLGIEFANASARARGSGDYAMMRELWMAEVGDRLDEVRGAIGEALDLQYDDVSRALAGGEGLVIHGNVDRPDTLEDCLPEGFSYVHGVVVDVEGMRLGFAGGGVATPLKARGEVSDEEMSSLLAQLGPVDVLCTHVPAAIRPLRQDVITGRSERGSEPIREYLERNQPRLHLYGDVHQPMATTWRVGSTHCHNAGYFRATGRYLRLDGPIVHVGRVS